MKLAGGNISPSKKYTIREDKESVAKLEKRIKEELGITRVDFELLANDDVATELIDHIESLQHQHGQHFNAILAQRPISATKDLAWVTPSRELVINPDYFNSYEAFKDILDELYKTGVLPKGYKNIEYIARHEYAHLITKSEIDSSKTFVKVLFGRTKQKDFISKNAMKNPYEFAADYLAITDNNKISKELKKYFGWED